MNWGVLIRGVLLELYVRTNPNLLLNPVTSDLRPLTVVWSVGWRYPYVLQNHNHVIIPFHIVIPAEK